jgi:FeS assembly SUF system protein
MTTHTPTPAAGQEETMSEPDAPALAPPTPETPEALATAAIEAEVVEALKTVFDPEIPVNIYELGLIYDIDVADDGRVELKMTLTSPGCPVAGSLPGEVETRVAAVPGVSSAHIELVWDPPWNPGLMTEAAKLQLGMF